MEDVLNVTAKTIEDESIYSLDYFPFNPIAGTDYNNPGIIQINIENQDEYFLPSKSWLQIDADLLTDAGARIAAGTNVTLTNNGIMYCFSNIKYQMAGNEIESLNHPGQATTMLGLLKYSKSYGVGPGLASCWEPDTNIAINDNGGFARRKAYIFNATAAAAVNGSFSIPLDADHFSGFAEDYGKVVYGMRHSLQLNRKANDNDAIFRAHGVAASKIVIKRITWWMARGQPSVSERSRLNNLALDNKITLQAGFRVRQCDSITIPVNSTSYTWNLGVKTERPRYIIIGLQTAKDDNQEHNAALFDHCNVSNMKVRINGQEYPPIDVNSNFSLNQSAGWYRRFMDFKQSFYGVEKTVSSMCVDGKEYKDLFPLYVFDVSRQSEKLGNSTVVDLAVTMTTSAAVAAGTIAYSLVISDRKMEFKVDGKRSVVVF